MTLIIQITPLIRRLTRYSIGRHVVANHLTGVSSTWIWNSWTKCGGDVTFPRFLNILNVNKIVLNEFIINDCSNFEGDWPWEVDRFTVSNLPLIMNNPDVSINFNFALSNTKIVYSDCWSIQLAITGPSHWLAHVRRRCPVFLTIVITVFIMIVAPERNV